MAQPVHNQPDPESPQGRMQLALFRVLRSLVFRGDPDTPLNELPVLQLRALYAISYHEGIRMQQLCAHMETKLPALSQVVERLVRRGLVERRADPSDRRAVQLYLQDSARELLAQANGNWQLRMDRTVAFMNSDSMQKAIDGLSELADSAERAVQQEKAAVNGDAGSDQLVELISLQRRSSRQAAEQE